MTVVPTLVPKELVLYPQIDIQHYREPKWAEGIYRVSIYSRLEVRREHCVKHIEYCRGLTIKNYDIKHAVELLKEDLLEYVNYLDTVQEESYTAYRIKVKLP